MEKLCQDIIASHERRRELLTQLKTDTLQLKGETASMLKGFRKQFKTFRDDFQAGREAWRKAASVLAKKRAKSQ